MSATNHIEAAAQAARGEPRNRSTGTLCGVIGATLEVIASIQARPQVIDHEDRQSVIVGLRQLGKCAYFLAEELDEKQKAKK